MANASPMDTLNSGEKFKRRIGTKYYRFTSTGDIEIIRIIRNKNVNTIIAVNDETYTGKIKPEDYITLTPQDLEKYRMLLPHAQMVACPVKTSDASNAVEDVLFLVSKCIDRNEGIEFMAPDLVCRQIITDMYAIIGGHDDCLGLSATRKACPVNVDFDRLWKTCVPIKDAKHTQFVSVYQTDTFDQLLGLLNTSTYDEMLKYYSDIVYKGMGIKGVCSSVRELMEVNGFYYDFLSIFDIMPMPKVIIKKIDNNFILYDMDLYRIEWAIKTKMSDVLITEFNYFVSDEKLQESSYSYIKIADSTGKIYVIQYSPVEGFQPDLYPESVRDGLPEQLSKYMS